MTGVWSAVTGTNIDGHVTLIHGSLDRSAGLLKLSRRLDDRFRVLRYDRRGYGRSTPHDGPFRMVDQVDDLDTLLGAQPAEDRPSVLVGHSFGGNVALAYASQRPDRVAAVVTYETPLSWRPWWPHGTAGSRALDWTHDPPAAAEGFMRRLIGDDRWERLPPSSRAARRREGTAMVGELSDLRAQPAWESADVGVPVLAMYGVDGQPHHRRAAETIAAEIDGAELCGVAGASHPGPNTHPDVVAGLITDFLDRRVSRVRR